MLQEIASLKAKLLEVTEEHKISMALNAKTVNSLVKMHEKTQEALEVKTNELAKIKQELQTVNLTNLELLQENQELKMNKNNFANSVLPSKLEKNSSLVQQMKTDLEVKVEVKEEILKDLHMVHDNSNQNEKLTKGEKNEEGWKLKEESYFDEVNYEMGIDFVTSKTFDKEHLKFPKMKEKEKNFAQSCSNSNSRELSNEKTSGILEKNLTKKLYKCRVLFCDDQFDTIDELTKHISLVHEKKKLTPTYSNHFMCRICYYLFSKIEELTEHHSSVHEGKKPSQSSNADTNLNPRKEETETSVPSDHQALKIIPRNSLLSLLTRDKPT